MAMPLFLFSGLAAKAERRRKVKETPTVKHAPPEPFFIGGRDETTSFRTNITVGIASAVVSTLSMLGSSDLSNGQDKIVATSEEKTEPQTNTNPENDVEESLPKEAIETIAETEEVAPVVLPPTPAGTADFDFDYDGKSDLGRWHAGSTEFKVRFTDDGTTASTIIGTSGAKPAPGDFDDDNIYDVMVFNNGTWTGKKSSDGTALSKTGFGASGDKLVVGDYDGGGKSDLAYWHAADGTWNIATGESGFATTLTPVAWGSTTVGDIPMVGDFDGDDKTDLSVFRASTGDWWILKSTGGTLTKSWGTDGDIPVPADYDGDGIADMAVWRPSTGTWWVLTSSSGFVSNFAQQWGFYGDQPVVGNYLGDGSAELGVWRPTTATWYFFNPDNGSSSVIPFGANGDFAIPSAFIKQTGFNVPADDLGEVKLSPKNATGSTNLYSQNFSWGTNLVSLPGRSGLDLNLGIGYYSLVWTKVGSTMVFDADAASMTPGFRFGFPMIEAPFMNGQMEKFTFIMITSSGQRIEFRETSVAGEFESVDGSYTFLKLKNAATPNDPVDDLEFSVRTTDGTLMSYSWLGGAYKCKLIKDRNGNYLSIAYNEYGDLSTITDTLGRIVTVNYNSELYPTTITQTWKDTNGAGGNVQHTWATFTYDDLEFQTDFEVASVPLEVAGPLNGQERVVLKKITYANTSSTEFTYNTYGQIWKIENDADDDHKLNHVRTNLQSPSANQPDCPRFTETYSWVENFNVDPEDGTPTEAEQEILIENSAPTNSTYTVSGGSSQNTSVVEVEMPEHPDGLYQIMHFGRAGSWNEGLPIATRDCIGSSCAAEKRWTWTNWTQDNTGVAYPLNPRVTETRVGDGTNTKRTTVDYHVYDSPNQTVSKFGLPSEVKTYKADLSTVMKRTTMEYDFTSTYLDRRIIGLPTETKTYGWSDGTSAEQYTSRTTYAYDHDDDFATEGLNQNVSPVQHDGTNYPTTLSAGRGNLTKVTKWDVTDDDNTALDIVTEMRYNKAGSLVAQITPWDGSSTRTTKIAYADNFNSSPGVSTYAYPTTITDPAGFASTVKYRYDIGANIEALGPAPDGNTYGKKSTRVFDSIGRLEKNSIYRYASSTWTEHAYTRYEYPSSGIESRVYNTLVDVDNDGNIAEDEVLTTSLFDGAGRVRKTRTAHPGSTGGFSAVLTEYDILGRVKRATVPTEVDSGWNPDGDDSAFLWNSNEYDWMGRVVRKIATDGADSPTPNASDVFITYAGCGCAGSLVTTIKGEEIIEKTWNESSPTSLGRRTQKLYQDILGRTIKSEIMEWDGTTPYLTTETSFNGRDQALTVEQTDEDAEVTQTTTMSYDGHGRLDEKHIPQQDAEAETSYGYNPDGSVSGVTDARGVITNYVYNNRGLVTDITWNVGATGIADPADVDITYDDAGNRLTMTDGLGTMAYEYNSLSQMTAETRDFTDTLTYAPNGVYRLEYSYHVGGQLKSLEDPYEDVINYGRDKSGRMSSVTGSSYGSVTSYISSPEYRAWGALKSLSFSNGAATATTFDSRLRPDTFELTKSGLGNPIMDKDYTYYADGSLRKLEDHRNDKFNRLNTYDSMGRLITAKTGMEARGTTATTQQLVDVPYRQAFQYNAFSNLEGRTNWHWGVQPNGSEGSMVNNRRDHVNWTYS